MAKPLTAGRLRCLQALAFGALKLTAAGKGELLEQLLGKSSFHELSNDEADRVIDAMKAKAGQTVTRPSGRDRRRVRAGAQIGTVTPLVTPAQRERLAQLTRDVIAAGLRSHYVAGVRERACGRASPATSIEAEKAIEAMKALHERVVAAGWRPPEQTA